MMLMNSRASYSTKGWRLNLNCQSLTGVTQKDKAVSHRAKKEQDVVIRYMVVREGFSE